MNDLEMTRLCAKAMGYSVVKGDARYKNGMAIATVDGEPVTNYDPLKHDAQAMALVKRFDIVIEREKDDSFATTLFVKRVGIKGFSTYVVRNQVDLNRAIVECVAKMQKGGVT